MKDTVVHRDAPRKRLLRDPSYSGFVPVKVIKRERAWSSIDKAQSIFPGDQHVPISSRPSMEVLWFAVCVAMATGVLFGLAPALTGAKAPPGDTLRNGTRTTTGGASLLQRGLVVVPAALSVVLLVGAGLFSQSLGQLQRTNMKLESKNRYIVHINAQAAGYKDEQVNAL